MATTYSAAKYEQYSDYDYFEAPLFEASGIVRFQNSKRIGPSGGLLASTGEVWCDRLLHLFARITRLYLTPLPEMKGVRLRFESVFGGILAGLLRKGHREFSSWSGLARINSSRHGASMSIQRSVEASATAASASNFRFRDPLDINPAYRDPNTIFISPTGWVGVVSNLRIDDTAQGVLRTMRHLLSSSYQVELRVTDHSSAGAPAPMPRDFAFIAVLADCFRELFQLGTRPDGTQTIEDPDL